MRRRCSLKKKVKKETVYLQIKAKECDNEDLVFRTKTLCVPFQIRETERTIDFCGTPQFWYDRNCVVRGRERNSNFFPRNITKYFSRRELVDADIEQIEEKFVGYFRDGNPMKLVFDRDNFSGEYEKNVFVNSPREIWNAVCENILEPKEEEHYIFF